MDDLDIVNQQGNWATQFKGANKSTTETELVIGLDFGTAYTKVVVGTNRGHHAVSFNTPAGPSYLLPGQFSIMDDGACLLGRHKGASRHVSDLKIALIESAPSQDKEVLISVFLALVLRKTRTWFLSNKEGIFAGNILDWYLNVGLPTDTYHDEALIAEYKKLIRHAWLMSVMPELITLDLAKKVWADPDAIEERLDEEDHLHPESIEVFPEFAAQIAGYVRSPQRRKGLHLLVDVGAGTVDVTTFNVHFDDESKEFAYPILHKKVLKMGSVFLMRRRGELYQGDMGWSPEQKIPSDSEFAECFDLSLDCVKRCSLHFQADLMEQVKDVLKYTREKRYRISKYWEEGIPTFLCGGGSHSEVYKAIINFIVKKPPTYCIDERVLPVPAGLEPDGMPLSGDLYGRLSVAYGLSFDAYDIGQIRPEDSIADDLMPDPLTVDYTDRYVGSECM